ncbi:early nodulin-like protein 20 [Bidens hawaiensis]|uniref:early nodulin-like protein 20 n=1 Tax=Bidens hawaiensis TaxID=980011 RepID=UPI00404B8247
MRKSGIVMNTNMMVAVVAAMAMLTCAMSRNAVRHQVGGKSMWIPNFNYTDWSLQEKFYVGDWLYFVYDKHMYNVLEVNETSYENCNEKDFIFNITRGAGRDVFELKQAKPYYFLASGGYCFGGMKLKVDVVEFVPAPDPSPPKSGSNIITGFNPIISLMVIVVWAGLFKISQEFN